MRIGAFKEGLAIRIQCRHVFAKGFYRAVFIILRVHSWVPDLLTLVQALMVFLKFMIPNCHVLTIVFIHFHYKAVPAQFSQTLTSPARTVQGNLKVDFKLQRNWIVVAQCSRGTCTFHIARSQGLLVLGYILPPLSEIAQNAGENLIASLEAAVSHQVNLAIP